MKRILSLDFGGSKLAAGIVDPAAGKVLLRLSLPTPQHRQASLEAMLHMGLSLLDEMPAEIGGVGVSFGGLVALDGRAVKRSHHVPGWEDFPLADALEEKFGAPAWVLNDADAAALGEFHFGAGQGPGQGPGLGAHSLLYLTVSTGFGGGLVLDGRLFRGAHSLAGEIGHMVLQPDGPPCPCGRQGCLEALASGRSIARRMTERLAGGTASSLSGTEVTAKSVAQAAASGDPLANEVWGEAMRWLGIGIASAANLLDPARVVVGGGLSRAGELLFEPVRRAARQHALVEGLEIVPAALGDEANLLGAAVYNPTNPYHSPA